MSLPVRILIGLVAGLALGIVASATESSALDLLVRFLTPVGQLWINAIRMTVVPLLVALVICAIAGQRHVNPGKAGLTLGATITTFIAFSSLLTWLAAPLLTGMIDISAETSRQILELAGTSGSDEVNLPPFDQWLTGLIPTNPLAAAATDSILPLLVFSLLFALALLRIGKQKAAVVTDFFSGLRDAMLVLIDWVMAVAPLGVFALVLPLAQTLGSDTIQLLSTFIILTCSLILVATLILYPVSVWFGSFSLRQFAVALAPVQVIGFTTRSSLATLPAMYRACTALQLPQQTAGLVLPIAVSLFKFASPIARTAGSYFVAQLYGIPLSPIEMLLIAALVGLFSFYSPGIPSGGLLIMAPLYLQIGLPVTGIGILIAVDLVIDMFITMANVTANLCVVTLVHRFSGPHRSQGNEPV